MAALDLNSLINYNYFCLITLIQRLENFDLISPKIDYIIKTYKPNHMPTVNQTCYIFQMVYFSPANMLSILLKRENKKGRRTNKSCSNYIASNTNVPLISLSLLPPFSLYSWQRYHWYHHKVLYIVVDKQLTQKMVYYT